MILESVQLLCTVYWILEPDTAEDYFKKGLIYRKTHANHPVSKWLRESLSNFMWTVSLAEELSNEHQFRYQPKREHKCMDIVRFVKQNPPKSLQDKGLTPAALGELIIQYCSIVKAMPANCKVYLP